MQKLITGYSLLEFLQRAQEAILEGYKFNFDDNDSVPQKFGNVYEAMMTLDEESIVFDNWKGSQPATEGTTAEPKTETTRRTRKVQAAQVTQEADGKQE